MPFEFDIEDPKEERHRFTAMLLMGISICSLLLGLVMQQDLVMQHDGKVAGLRLEYERYSQPTFTPQGAARVEAEHFALGGQKFGYYAVYAGNAGNQYRDEDIDIFSIGKDRYAISLHSSEWVRYNVRLPKAGKYQISVRVSTGTEQLRFRVDANGQQVFANAIPVSDSIYRNIVVGEVEMKEGMNDVRIVSNQNALQIDYFDLTPIK